MKCAIKDTNLPFRVVCVLPSKCYFGRNDISFVYSKLIQNNRIAKIVRVTSFFFHPLKSSATPVLCMHAVTRDVITKIMSPFKRRRSVQFELQDRVGRLAQYDNISTHNNVHNSRCTSLPGGKVSLCLASLFFSADSYPPALPRAINNCPRSRLSGNAHYSVQLCERYRYLRAVYQEIRLSAT